MANPDLKIVHIKDGAAFLEFIKDAERMYKSGDLKDFIGIMRTENKERGSFIEHHWFGDSSCLYLLGLCVRMKSIIVDYMDGSR